LSEGGFFVQGRKVVPDLSGAAWFPDLGLLAVADLHFEKGTSFVRRGLRLPPYDTKATLKSLVDVVARYSPRQVVALGDSFHDGDGPARLDQDDVACLQGLTSSTNWVWIYGNHDPITTKGIDHLGGHAHEDFEIGKLRFRHEPTGAAGEVSGHLHPGAAVHVRGRRIRRRCFATDGLCLILPAFGAYTGSLNVCDPAFHSVLRSGFHAHLIGRDKVYAVSESKLQGDRMAG
jgi:uncharacterized protein